jgi:DNA ligase (NAD+)
LGKRVQKVLGDVPLEYTCELKYDGASISITYENGILKGPLQEEMDFRADVTSNIKTIKSIPLQLKGDFAKFDVRGEIVLPFPDLKNESGLNRNWRSTLF